MTDRLGDAVAEVLSSSRIAAEGFRKNQQFDPLVAGSGVTNRYQQPQPRQFIHDGAVDACIGPQ
jgi:hypothetical protein